jgi:hypothetical protein
MLEDKLCKSVNWSNYNWAIYNKIKIERWGYIEVLRDERTDREDA